MNDSERIAFLKANIIEVDSLLVMIEQATKLPFIEWDEEDGEDQIYVFTSQDKFKDKVKSYMDMKHKVMGASLEKDIRHKFFADLYAYGVSQVVVCTSDSEVKLKLPQIIHKPSFDHIPEKMRPLLNPELEISVIYFMQELAREIAQEEKKNIKELEEEMARNISISKYMIAVKLKEAPAEDWDGRLEEGKFDIVFITNQDGETYLPIFSDVVEFNKFNLKKEFLSIIISVDQLMEFFGGNCMGAILNPSSLSFRLLKTTMDSILKRFAPSVAESEEEKTEA